jgi:hypothetical protein
MMSWAALRSAAFVRLVTFLATVLVVCALLPVPAASPGDLSASGVQSAPGTQSAPLALSAPVAAADSAGGRPVTGLSATGLINAAEMREPFFRFALGLIATDSLGVWTRTDLDRYIAASGEPTRLPLARMVNVERRVAVGAERERRAGSVVERVWRIELTEAFTVPMPYSILGYHPGSLLFSHEVILSEWHLGSPDLAFTIDGRERLFTTAGLITVRIDAGYLVLDADGWLDALLGKALDDAWTVGFAFGRLNGRLVGVGISVNRSGRKIYGEIDFAKDEVMAHGRPPARALNYYCRPWTAPPQGQPDRAWQFERSEDDAGGG